MKPPERRSIKELATLYELEPELRDLYVEGRNDAALLNWYLRKRTSRDFAIYEIDAVDIPTALLEFHGLPIGSSGRIRALAYELEKALDVNGRRCVRLIVDADFDHVLDVKSTCSLLLRTDFANFEMHLFSESVVNKLTTVVLLGCEYSARTILEEIQGVLQRLFIIRLSNCTLNLGLSWISFERCCETSGASIQFDEQEFLRRYVLNGGMKDELGNLLAQIAIHERGLKQDPRMQMNGHDFLALLRWYLRPIVKERHPLSDERTFSRVICGCVNIDELDSASMFQEIIAFLSD